MERLRKQGRRVKALDERPKLTWEVPIWAAFMALNRTRQAGMAGAMPLAATDVRSYLETRGYSGRSLAEAMDLVMDLDSLALSLFSKESDGKGSDTQARG